MSDISIYMQNGQATVTSLEVSNHYNKRHDNVLRIIEQIIEEASEFSHLNFEAAEYLDGQSKPRKMYEMTRDGFTLLSNRFTGKKALQFQIRFIQAFNQMESVLENRAGHTTPALPGNTPHQLPDQSHRYYLREETATGELISQTLITPDILSQFVDDHMIDNMLIARKWLRETLEWNYQQAAIAASAIQKHNNFMLNRAYHPDPATAQKMREQNILSRLENL